MKKNKKTKKALGYKFVCFMVHAFYGRRQFLGVENLPEEECIVVGNHCQMDGPISCELYFPAEKKIWCIGDMMNLKDVPSYAFQDFWANKPRSVRWFYKILSYIIAPFSVFFFTNADTIAVYKDSRTLSTFRDTQTALENGEKVIIFPEKRQEYNGIVNEFQDKFIDVARFYYKKTNKKIAFVPMYNAPSLKKVVLGKPVYFDPEKPMQEEREFLLNYLKEEITKLALELPPHKVTPYSNIGKKNYSWSKEE